MLFNPDNLPAIPPELRALRRWVNWQYAQDRKGRMTKEPINPHMGTHASSTDPASWGTLEEALVLCTKHPDTFGLGVVFTDGDPLYLGIDLDHMGEDDTRLTVAQAQTVCERLRHTYAEHSPSDTGIHLIARVAAFGRGIKRTRGELYARGRFFTVTGNALPGHPSAIGAIDQATVDWLIQQIAPEGARSPASASAPYTPADDPGESYEVPQGILMRLMANPAFHKRWFRIPPLLPSVSEEEMAIGSLAMHAGCADRDIMGLWYAWWTVHGLPAKPHRFAVTLKTLRESQSPRTTSEDITPHEAEETVTDLGIPLESLVCVSRNPDRYHVRLTGYPDAIRIDGFDKLSAQATWRALVFAHTGIALAPMKRHVWDQKFLFLSQLMTYDIVDESEEGGETAAWIDSYLTGSTAPTIGQGRQFATIKDEYPFQENDVVHFTLKELLMHVRQHYSTGLTQPLLIHRLTAIGYMARQIIVEGTDPQGKRKVVNKKYWHRTKNRVSS